MDIPFNTCCPDEKIINLIGRLELTKRERGATEEQIYNLQLCLKDPEIRKKWSKRDGTSLLELERLYHDLKFRRKLYRDLRRESKENKQKNKDSQKIKEKTDG